MLIAHNCLVCHCVPMRDWAINYILKVLEERDWSANRLAKEAGLSASTINRPLREKDWPNRLARETIRKVQEASGVDPSPFIPDEFHEERALFSRPPRRQTEAGRILENLDQGNPVETGPNAQTRNEIKIAVVGDLAQIVATVDKLGLTRLRAKLDAIESMLDD